MKRILLAGAAVAIVLVVGTSPIVPTPPKTYTPDQLARWACSAELKRHAVDPQSYRDIDRPNWIVSPEGDVRLVQAVFSGTNLFGGRVQNQVVCIVDAAGGVTFEEAGA